MATGRSAKTVGAWKIGASYIIRTVTYYFTGRLVDVTEHELVLEDCAWIADTGRWTDALVGGVDSLSEVEPYPAGSVIIGRGAIVDACIWKHPLPREQK